VEPDGLTGKRLASARKEIRVSQRALAAELGVSVRTIQNYEAGRFVPYRHLDTLSRLLRCNPSWLLYGHDQDLDELLARSRHERGRLQQNLERLVELRTRLADNAGRGEATLADPASPER